MRSFFRLSRARERGRRTREDEEEYPAARRRFSPPLIFSQVSAPGSSRFSRRACLPNHRPSVRRSMRRVLIGRFLARIEIFSPGFFLVSRTAEPASVVFQMRTREDKADLGPPGDRGVRVTRSLGCGGIRPVSHSPRRARRSTRTSSPCTPLRPCPPSTSPRSAVRRRPHPRARRLVARRAASPSSTSSHPSSSLRVVARNDTTTSDAPRVAPRSAPISRPDLARRLTTPRAPASLPPQPRGEARQLRQVRARASAVPDRRRKRVSATVATTRREAMRVNRSLDPFPSAHFPGCR